MTTCERYQRQLIEGGASALASDQRAQRHLDGCTKCQAVLDSQARLDDALAALPVIDAPDHVVRRVLEAIEKDAGAPKRRGRRGGWVTRNSHWLAAAVAAMCLGIWAYQLVFVPKVAEMLSHPYSNRDPRRESADHSGPATGGAFGDFDTSGQQSRPPTPGDLTTQLQERNQEFGREKGDKASFEGEIARSPGGAGHGQMDNGLHDLSESARREVGQSAESPEKLDTYFSSTEHREGQSSGAYRDSERQDRESWDRNGRSSVTTRGLSQNKPSFGDQGDVDGDRGAREGGRVAADKKPASLKRKGKLSGEARAPEIQTENFRRKNEQPRSSEESAAPELQVTAERVASLEADREFPPDEQQNADDYGVEASVEGGVIGGVVGGLLGGAMAGADPDVPVRMTADVHQPRLLSQVSPEYPEMARKARMQGIVILELVISREGAVVDAEVIRSLNAVLDQEALRAVRQWIYAPATFQGQPISVFLTVTVHFKLEPPAPASSPRIDPNLAAIQFQESRARLEGVEFKDATGYWANTYVPGDADFRVLAARLTDRAPFGERQLDLGSHEPIRPFDPPTSRALGVHLHADKSHLDGETRHLIQVGLAATAQHGGRRPAMNVALILDLTGGVTAETDRALRALTLALGRAREPGDRFSLIVAGRPGAMVVGCQDFRHGPLTVALSDVLGPEPPEARSLDLIQAFRLASETARRSDDPQAPLGSSVVLLATSRALGAETGTLARLAHANATDGVPVGVIAVGAGTDRAEIDAIVLAGQGNRRQLASPGDAERVVDAEFASVGRAIARAVRLSIRLAPGVRLIDVLGSRRLDEPQAERVRQAEQSIDQRLSKNLGINQDRGDDEDGIQIVIPTFYADDDHVILLDVVSEGPGPIAEVRLRFKDLVRLSNETVRASLSLPRGADQPGPLEHSVTRSLLAREVAGGLEAAAALLASNRADAASARLDHLRQLLIGMRWTVPGFDQDPDLTQDLVMLEEYMSALHDLAPDSLSDSMRYASRLKVLPRPGE